MVQKYLFRLWCHTNKLSEAFYWRTLYSIPLVGENAISVGTKRVFKSLILMFGPSGVPLFYFISEDYLRARFKNSITALVYSSMCECEMTNRKMQTRAQTTTLWWFPKKKQTNKEREKNKDKTAADQQTSEERLNRLRRESAGPWRPKRLSASLRRS